MFNHEEINRPLGRAESSIWLLDRLSQLNGVLAARIHGRLTEATLRTALDALQARHPMCQVRVIDWLEGGPQFTSEDVPPIPLWVSESPPTSWADAVREELGMSLFHPTGPLLRVALYRYGPQESLLTLTFHQCAIDHPSALILLRDVLRLAAGDSDTQLRALVPLHPRGSLDELRPHGGRGVRGVLRALRLLFRQLREQLLGQGPLQLPADAPTSPVEERFSVMSHTLDPAHTDALLQACEKAGATPYGAISAAFLQALGKELGGEKSAPLGVAHVVDLRAETRPLVGEDVGMFSGLLQLPRTLAPGAPLWTVAAQESETLKRRFADGECWSTPTAAQWLIRPLNRLTGGKEGDAVAFRERLGRFTSNTLTAMDLGEVSYFSDIGHLSVESLRLVAKPALGGLFLSVQRYGGQLEWSLTYPSPTYFDDHIAAVMDRAAHRLVGELRVEQAA